MKEYAINKGLTFSIKTTSTNGESKAIITKDDNNNITLSFCYPEAENLTELAGKPVYYHVKFHFPSQYLNNYFSLYSENYFQGFYNYEEQELCCNKQMILHDIIHSKLEGAYRSMFLESKALGLLLCFQKEIIQPVSSCVACKFLMNPAEKEKIQKAKEIILSRLSNPLTIPELSLEVGINQCYLKKGFKEVFGTTIYDFVQEQRMMKARLLLSTTELTVSQVADKIGFSSISNFSSAFKKHTGVFPSELPKSFG
ncbi:MAG: helix-turn-helix transcriptional regulator [Sphingobacteriales bacterium]|nr:MAG: helix-turn-helix transcriptional regulator [Sphingobacteriales bacterium]